MEAYQQRVVDELTELNDKHDKLKRFINSDLFLKVGTQEKARMIVQLDIMQSYKSILIARISSF